VTKERLQQLLDEGPKPVRERPVVLVVDDHPAVREALLELHGLAAEGAATPEQAVARVSAGGVGVVVQDLNFRGAATDGAEGARLFDALRLLDPQLPIVLMTAWAQLPAAVALVRARARTTSRSPGTTTR